MNIHTTLHNKVYIYQTLHIIMNIYATLHNKVYIY